MYVCIYISGGGGEGVGVGVGMVVEHDYTII